MDPSQRWRFFCIGYLLFCFLYLGTGTLTLSRATTLPLSLLDTTIPFWEKTIWIYLSQFVIAFLIPFKVRDSRTLTLTYYSIALASLISFFVFTVYPTQMPLRMEGEEAVERVLFAFLYSIDVDANCFPSLHVAVATLAGYGLYRSTRSLLFVIWSLLICISTLTVKQHYFVDVVGGLVIAGGSLLVVCRLVPEPLDQTPRHNEGDDQ